MRNRLDRFTLAALAALPEGAYDLSHDKVAEEAVALGKAIMAAVDREEVLAVNQVPPSPCVTEILPASVPSLKWTKHTHAHLGTWWQGKKVDWYPATGKLVYNGLTYSIGPRYAYVDHYIRTKLPNGRD